MIQVDGDMFQMGCWFTHRALTPPHAWKKAGDLLATTNQQSKYLPETSIAPENGWLEDKFPFGKP